MIIWVDKMKTIAIANQKGGCGKTTTAVNVAASFAHVGKRVIIVDLDSQAHATLGLGVVPEELHRTIYDIITDPQFSTAKAVMKTNTEGLDIIPSNILLSGAESELVTMYDREYVLQKHLESLGDDYDVCVIDCSPSLSILTLNALVASTDVLIPVQTHYYALEGLKQLLETIDVVKSRFNSSLKILGVLLTFVESRTLLSREVQRQMKDFFGKLVFDTVIHRNVRLAEAPSAGEPVLAYDVNSRGAQEYLALINEIIEHEEKSRITQEDIINL